MWYLFLGTIWLETKPKPYIYLAKTLLHEKPVMTANV